MSTKPKIASPYVRIDDVADYFDVSTSTVRTWVNDGMIPASAYIKSGRTYRFRLPEVEQALLGEDPKEEAEVPDEDSRQLNLDFGNGDDAA